MADAEHKPITSAQEEAPETGKQANPLRRTLLIGLAAVILIAALLALLWYLLIGAHRVSTDNAYVGAEVAQVTPLVEGTVADVRVHETQSVKRGDILMLIDPADARIKVAQAEADLFAARQKYEQTAATGDALAATLQGRGADIANAAARLAAADADLKRAGIDLERRRALAPDGAVSGDELSTATNAYARAKAARDQAAADLESARATRTAAHGSLAANQALTRNTTLADNPDVAAAQAKLDAAKLDLARTVIRAPIDGVIVNRKAQIGQHVAAGAQVMQVVPERQVYVDANFKEGQLARVRVGQPVKLTSDLYGGGVVYHGKVVGFGGGTGAAFATIPAQNATGNWIKVVQRLPIRVALDPRELADHPLRVGLSMTATIDIG